MKIVRQILDRMPAGDYRIQDKKVTPPPRARIDESMEALIHHFKIFTEGFKVPEGEVYVAIESPRGEIGCYIASDGSAKPYRMHIRAPELRQHPVPAAHDARRADRRRRRRDLLRRPGPRDDGGSADGPAERCQRRARQGDHRPLSRRPVGDDPAAAPRPAARRLRHQRGDEAHRRAGRGHVGRGARHGDVLRDVQVRAGRQVPDQHLRHDVVRAAGRRRADAPRRAQARHQGRQHHRRRPDHAGARRVPGGVHRGAVPAGQLPPPLPGHTEPSRRAHRRPARRPARRRDPAARHGRPRPPAHPVRSRRRRRPTRRRHRPRRPGCRTPARRRHDRHHLPAGAGVRRRRPAADRHVALRVRGRLHARSVPRHRRLRGLRRPRWQVAGRRARRGQGRHGARPRRRRLPGRREVGAHPPGVCGRATSSSTATRASRAPTRTAC